MAARRAGTGAAGVEWVFRASDSAVFDALAKGERGASLSQYFGATAYAELSTMARKAARAPARPKRRTGPPVIILPGIMGSTLGASPARRGGAPTVFWIDPHRIAEGGLMALAIPAGRPLKPLGVQLFSYARLKLQLQIDGFDVRFHAYDWRLGLDELGRELAARIAAGREPVILIGHSMGGLVARMAMRLLPKRSVRKLVMLGTPNRGSFAPILAIRGSYPFVRKVATFDPAHSAEYLAQNVFRTFSGLYHLLPSRTRTADIDLYDTASWPARGPSPDPRILREAESVRRRLAPPDPRMTHIVGVNRETIVGVRRTGSRFVYDIGFNGDGTVPLALALLPAVRTYYVEEAHGNLASNPQVIAAAGDLIRRGRTRLLPERWRRRSKVRAHVDDAQLSRFDGPKIDWRGLAPAQRAAAVAELNDGGKGFGGKK